MCLSAVPFAAVLSAQYIDDLHEFIKVVVILFNILFSVKCTHCQYSPVISFTL